MPRALSRRARIIDAPGRGAQPRRRRSERGRGYWPLAVAFDEAAALAGVCAEMAAPAAAPGASGGAPASFRGGPLDCTGPCTVAAASAPFETALLAPGRCFLR